MVVVVVRAVVRVANVILVEVLYLHVGFMVAMVVVVVDLLYKLTVQLLTIACQSILVTFFNVLFHSFTLLQSGLVFC